MADKFGALELPAPTSDVPLGDPGLGRLGGFLQAVINAYSATAWAAANRGAPGEERLTARSVQLFNPRENGFNENALPALFVWRSKGKSSDLASADWLVDDGEIEVMWALPLTTTEKQRDRGVFMNAVAKTVELALNKGRETVWTDPTDPDPLAASRIADPDAFLLSRATSTSPADYSGASLDGELGAAALAPPRNLTLTTAATVGATINTSAPFVITYKNAIGATTTKSIQPTNSHGGETLSLGSDVKQLVSIHDPGQLAVEGSYSVGAAAWVGLGSVLSRAGFAQVAVDTWRAGHEKIDIVNSAQRAIEHAGIFALCMTLRARETATADPVNVIRYPYSGTPHEVVSVHQPGADFIPSIDLA